jgi:hypothetical protein
VPILTGFPISSSTGVSVVGRFRSCCGRQEREALLRHEVRAFCLAGGNLRAAEMAQLYLAEIPAIGRACSVPGPFLYAVSKRGIRRLELD